MSDLGYTYINELSKHVGESVHLRGWVFNTRSSGKIRFFILLEGTGFLQCVAGKQDVSESEFEVLSGLTQESSVEVSGAVREDKRAPGGYELNLTSVRRLHAAEGYPITPKEHSAPFLLDHRHLWFRSRKQHVVLRVRHFTVKAIRDFLNNNGGDEANSRNVITRNNIAIIEGAMITDDNGLIDMDYDMLYRYP